MASLGWVTPGAATEGVTPLFFLINLATFLCHPLQGVTSHLFYLSDLVSPLFFVNLPTKNFPSGVTRGSPPPRPPSDATASSEHRTYSCRCVRRRQDGDRPHTCTDRNRPHCDRNAHSLHCLSHTRPRLYTQVIVCLLYTSDAADE